jgi:hypothetical protein
MSYIQWGGKRWYQPKPQPRKPDINELMKPLSEKVGRGNIWGSVITNVYKDGAAAGPSIDPDAQAFLDAVVAAGGTIDSTITDATDVLVTDLKTAGVWSKIDVFLPVVGGTANSHKINLVEPSNATFDYTYFGTVNHSVSGMTRDASLGAVVPTWYVEDLVQSTTGSSHYALYRNRVSADVAINGYLDTSEGNPYRYFCIGNNGSSAYGELYGRYNQSWNAISNNGLGLMTLNKNGSSLSLYQNNSLINTIASDAFYTAPSTEKIPVLAIWWTNYPDNIYPDPTDQRVSTLSIGAGLSSTERADLDTAIENFNTTLGRAI